MQSKAYLSVNNFSPQNKMMVSLILIFKLKFDVMINENRREITIIIKNIPLNDSSRLFVDFGIKICDRDSQYNTKPMLNATKCFIDSIINIKEIW